MTAVDYAVTLEMGLFGRKKVIENPEVNADTPVAGTSTTSTTGNVSRTGLRPSHHEGAGVISLTPRILQFLLASLILALVGYAQHVYAHTFVRLSGHTSKKSSLSTL